MTTTLELLTEEELDRCSQYQERFPKTYNGEFYPNLDQSWEQLTIDTMIWLKDWIIQNQTMDTIMREIINRTKF